MTDFFRFLPKHKTCSLTSNNQMDLVWRPIIILENRSFKKFLAIQLKYDGAKSKNIHKFGNKIIWGRQNNFVFV